MKPLVRAIKPHLKPGDTVARCGRLFLDLPVYLERQVVVVGMIKGFEFGAAREDTSRSVISYNDLRRRWTSPERIFLVMQRKQFEYMRHKFPRSFVVLGMTPRVVVIANHR